MKILTINITIYVLIIMIILYCFCLKDKSTHKWVGFIQNHLFIIVFLLVMNTLSFALAMRGTQKEYYIERQSVDGTEKEYSFEADVGGQPIPFKLVVPPKKLKPKEAEALIDDAFLYLDGHIVGENKSLEKVDKDLDFSIDREKYPFDVEVNPDDYRLLDEDGIIRNEQEQLVGLGYSDKDMLSGILTAVNIKMSYGDIEKEKRYSFTLFPKEKSDAEKTLSEIEKLYARKERESEYESGFILPAVYKGIDIVSLEKKGFGPEAVLLMGVIFSGLLILREAENVRTQNVRRNRQLLQAYPWFVNEMVLLLGAGMQVRNVFALLISEYDGNDYRKPLVEELIRAKHDFDIGLAEEKIYYELGRRLKLPCYIKMLTLLEQNVTKGTKGLVAVLEQEERNALLERMNLAKKKGEEAGTKLLGPMMILLIIVMLIIMVPAFMSFV